MQDVLVVESIGAIRPWLEAILRQIWGDGLRISRYPVCQPAQDIIQKTHCFGLALLDISLPNPHGLDLTRSIRRHCPDAHIVATVLLDDEESLLQAILAGAHGYLLKDTPAELFAQELLAILRDDPPMSPALARRILRHFEPDPAWDTGIMPALDFKESEVLRLIAKGFNKQETADLLGLTYTRIAHFIRNVYRKLAATGLTDT
ncbi:response regulator transcription factor [Candidatus Thiothrix sp. Deng01]|uniref:Response regulator transcription factor n=1 Tax=Candidatus Thiothrix phosphatis TaxID=3112415 RepID=A0ABU6CVU5_9GAMM|nr:response regulator transcription factor [Candidatus Thiothrix sp. Deng01]MEB4590254.1 response regulator transcription factor [Candidatus Thiothrix sp. Deng01]